MSDITNEQRAEWAASGLDAYGIAKEGRANYDDPVDMVQDMIADLLHLVRAHGGDVILTMHYAHSNFKAEEEEAGK